MKLHQALEVQRGEVIAFVGAGGKSAALLALGHELAALGWRALATTTTRIGRGQLDHMPAHLPLDSDPAHITNRLDAHRFVFLTGEIGAEKVRGATPDQIPRLLDAVACDALLIEADGARRLPLKFPYDHEPVIPTQATLVIVLVGLSVLGQPLDEAHVYNAGAIAERYGYAPGDVVRPGLIAQLLLDPAAVRRGVPEDARVVALLNQVPAAGAGFEQALMIARASLHAPAVDAVAIGSVQDDDPIHAVLRPGG